MTAADMVIRDLADGEADALLRITNLECEVAIGRELLSETLRQLAQQTAHLEAARRAIAVLRLRPERERTAA